jgi:hypothetical protein
MVGYLYYIRLGERFVSESLSNYYSTPSRVEETGHRFFTAKPPKEEARMKPGRLLRERPCAMI